MEKPSQLVLTMDFLADSCLIDAAITQIYSVFLDLQGTSDQEYDHNANAAVQEIVAIPRVR